MSVQPVRGYLGISEVLAQLRVDFPDISVSKIRFLETEGLIEPARSPAGYRRFCAADVDRLRYILAAQRDQYLPLRVIKDRLARAEPGWAEPGRAESGRAESGRAEAGRPEPGRADASRPGDRGSGEVRRSFPVEGSIGRDEGKPAGLAGHQPGRGPGDDGDVAASQLLTRRDLLEAAGMTEALLTELDTFGLLRRIGRHYGPDALRVARAAVALTAYGVEARHLRAVRAAAERETTMIESLVAPILRQRGAGARELAGRTAGELADLVLRLHDALVDGALAEAGLAGPVGERAARESTTTAAVTGATA